MSASTAGSGWRPSKVDWSTLLDPLGVACREAGEAIRAIRQQGFAVERKGDASPVTEADRAAEAILLAALERHAAGVPVVAEEEVAAGHAVLVAAGGRVDAVDGSPLVYGKAAFLNPGFAATAGWQGPPLQRYMPD